MEDFCAVVPKYLETVRFAKLQGMEYGDAVLDELQMWTDNFGTFIKAVVLILRTAGAVPKSPTVKRLQF